MWKRLLHPTNRSIRLGVGLLLAGLFCIQCTRTEAFKESDHIIAISGSELGTTNPAAVEELVTLAKEDQIALLERCLANYRSSYKDFTCTFIKQEMIRGSLNQEQEISVKHIDEPFSVAMAWVKNAPLADRILYVEGKNDNQMLVRPTGIILRALVGGYLAKPPDGPEAMQSTLRPVSLFGFERGLESLLEVYHKAQQAGDLKTEWGQFAEVSGRKCLVIVRYLPAKDGYPSHKTVIYIDVDRLVPLCIEGFDWDNNLQCRYIYQDVKFNVGLTADDFLPETNEMVVK